jgi:hypothetical protein
VPAAVTQLKAAFDHVTAQRIFYGSQLTQLDTTEAYLANDKVQLASQENTAVGIDLAMPQRMFSARSRRVRPFWPRAARYRTSACWII